MTFLLLCCFAPAKPIRFSKIPVVGIVSCEILESKPGSESTPGLFYICTCYILLFPLWFSPHPCTIGLCCLESEHCFIFHMEGLDEHKLMNTNCNTYIKLTAAMTAPRWCCQKIYLFTKKSGQNEL